MSDFLTTIVAQKRIEVAAAEQRVPLETLRGRAAARRDRRPFGAALAGPGVRIIAEIKRASPSRGAIDLDLDPARLAREYAAGGAAALSVLTEGAFFKGAIDDLQAARAAVALPVLRKDFILTPYQVVESAASGADAILLIVRILSDGELAGLQALALEWGLDALVEIHDARYVERARRLGVRLVGINNRDLARFEMDPGNAARLAGLFPADTVIVAASGVASPQDIRRGLEAGIRRFLVGECLVRSPDPSGVLRSFVDCEQTAATGDP